MDLLVKVDNFEMRSPYKVLDRRDIIEVRMVRVDMSVCTMRRESLDMGFLHQPSLVVLNGMVAPKDVLEGGEVIVV